MDKNISGKQRLSNIMLKTRLIAERNMRAYLKDEIDVLPAWNHRELIAREFDRLAGRIHCGND